MKKTHKLISLLLCLVLLLGAFAGCAKQEEPAQEETPAPAVEEPAQTPAVEEPAQTPAEEPAEESYLPLVKDGSETITIGLMQNVNTENYETNDYTKWIEEQTGINLDFVYFSSDGKEAATQLALMMNAGEKLPDILWHFSGLSQDAGNEYGMDGYFIDLMPYFEQYSHFFEEMRQNLSIDADNVIAYGINPADNALYAFPGYQLNLAIDHYTNHLMVNKAWLDKVGEEVPTTVDDLVNVLTKFVSEDPNGNGTADEMGMVGIVSRTRGNILEYVLNAYIPVEDNYMYNQEDGKIYLPYATDEYRQGLIKLNEMYAAGLISPLSFTMAENSEIMALFTPDDGVSIAGVVAGHPTLITAEGAENVFEYVALPNLAAETDKGGYIAGRSATFQYCTYITADCENPELAFKLLDFMAGEDSTISQRYGIKGVHWDYAPEGLIDDDGVEVRYLVNDYSVFSNQNNVNWHQIGATLFEWNNLRGRSANEVEGESEAWSDRFADFKSDLTEVWKSCPESDAFVYKLVYNAEENEVVSENQKLLLQYVEEARALFVTGTMDPTNDADWQTYLSNLEAQGMNELLAAAQSAYDRQTK